MLWFMPLTSLFFEPAHYFDNLAVKSGFLAAKFIISILSFSATTNSFSWLHSFFKDPEYSRLNFLSITAHEL